MGVMAGANRTRRAIPVPVARARAAAMALPIVAGALDDLEPSVSLKADAAWHPIHVVSNVSALDVLRGVDASRWPYNEASYDRARRQNATVVGEHAGFSDLFVPIADAAGAWGVLVARAVAGAAVTRHGAPVGKALAVTGTTPRSTWSPPCRNGA
jgi:hypothetical protein